MINIVVGNNNDKLLPICIESLLGQTLPVQIYVLKCTDQCKERYKDKIIPVGIPAIDLVVTGLGLGQNQSGDAFGLVTANQVCYKSKYKILWDRLQKNDAVSYVYSDYELNNQYQIEFPFDLRVIGTGYRPKPFGLFKTSSCKGLNPSTIMDQLMQTTMFLHCPESLYGEQNDPYYR